MQDLVASSSEVADCNQLNNPLATLPIYGGHEKHFLGLVLGLSVLGYRRNMALQHGGLLLLPMWI